MHSFQIKRSCIALMLSLLMSAALLPVAGVAQDAPQAPPPSGQAPDGALPPGPGRMPREPRSPRVRDREPRGPGFHMGPPGRWWDEPELAQRIGISADQRQKMDDIFNSTRLKLIDLKAALEKEEAIMEPLVQADSPDEGKVLGQIDRVAQARAELEKANTRMLFELRHQLTHEQWLKLQADRDRGRRGDGPGGRLGPPDALPPPAE